jgi:anti-sigma-K factor RskA
VSERRDERLERLTRTLRALPADAWTPAEPPPLDRERALAVRPAGARAPGRRRLTLTLSPAVWAVAALVLLAAGTGLGALLFGGDGGAAAPGTSVALGPLPDAGARPVRASVVLPRSGSGDIRLEIRGAAPTPAGHVEELWLMDAGAKRLVSVGTFRVGPDGRADVRFHTGIDPHRYQYLDVSVEPEDGDPAHSGQSVLRSRKLS